MRTSLEISSGTGFILSMRNESLLSRLFANEGAVEVLSRVAESAGVIDVATFVNFAEVSGVGNAATLFSRFTEMGILIKGNNGYYISSYGKRLDILIRGIEGRETIDEVIRRLYALNPRNRPYELLTGGLTESFVGSLAAKPDFIRLLICSPWIRLQESLRQQFVGAIADADKLYSGSVQIEIVTRPAGGRHPWQRQVQDTLALMTDLGATIYTNQNLHAKLFMRQPGPKGGVQSATLGSENLTGARNIELGIRIDNDSQILQNLQLWFHSITYKSSLSGGVT